MLVQAVLVGDNLAGVTLITDGGGGVQLQAVGTLLFGPAKVNVPLLQAVSETATFTTADLPGARVPDAGVKVTPARLLLVDQLSFPCAPAVEVRVALQVQPLPLAVQLLSPAAKLVGVTDSDGGDAATATLFPRNSDGSRSSSMTISPVISHRVV